MKVCKGCGATLQDVKKEEIGYTPKMEADLCQRCFRMKHYGDVTISMKQGIDPFDVLKKIRDIDALFLWVVDSFDFEANMIEGLNRHFMDKSIVMVVTKCDLLPKTLTHEKMEEFVYTRLKEKDLVVDDVVFLNDLRDVKRAQRELDSVKACIQTYRKGRDLVVMGMANAGKSTFLNALLEMDDLTVSHYPGTTLEARAIAYEDYMVYDTPGLTRNDSYLTYIDESISKQIIPSKALKPLVYQLYEDQSLAIAGLARIDVMGIKSMSAVWYGKDGLQVHRGKQVNADKLWTEHLGEYLTPTLDTNMKDMEVYTFSNLKGKNDIVIYGLGWICIHGDVQTIRVYVHKGIGVCIRKAMI